MITEAFQLDPAIAARSSNNTSSSGSGGSSNRVGQPSMAVSPVEERPSRPAGAKTDR